MKMSFFPTEWQSQPWSAPVSNEHLNELKLGCWQWGPNVRVSIFDLFIGGHRLTYKPSRSFDLCIKLNLII